MLITPHFSLEEFFRPARVRNGRTFAPAPYPPDWIDERLRPLCALLEELRRALGGKAILVISGYRDPAYNRAIGGARASQHMQGRAADIVVAGVRPVRVHQVATALHDGGTRVPGLGLYPGFVHVDVREGKVARWTGSRADG